MGNAKDISVFSLALCYLLLLIVIFVLRKSRVPLAKKLVISVARMTGQLFLMGYFLEYLFRLGNPFVNVLWLLVMCGFASFSIISGTELRLKYYAVPIFIAAVGSTGFVLMYYNWLVVRLDDPFSARYAIPIGGMLLGNSMRGVIVLLNNFYGAIRKEEVRFQFALASGAGRMQALAPFFRESLRLALSPTVASVATMGIVSLPGMMTGQIISGESPLSAIRYQMAIWAAIVTSTTLCILFSMLLSVRVSFDDWGNLRKDIFKK